MSEQVTVYQLGAVTYHELVKKAQIEPVWAVFLDPRVFEMSFGWFQTRKRRGYSAEDAASFMEGFRAGKMIVDGAAAKRGGKV